jgi:hypothetical protein
MSIISLIIKENLLPKAQILYRYDLLSPLLLLESQDLWVFKFYESYSNS